MFFPAESHNTSDPTPYLQAEGARMRELHQAGIAETVFLKADRSGAIILLRDADAAAARDALSSPPLVANGITSLGEFTEVVSAIPAGFPWDRKAAAHAEIFGVLADATGDPWAARAVAVNPRD